MNREIVKANTMPELLQLAQILAESKLFGVQSKEQAVAVILTGQDLGLSAAQSLRAIYVVQGKPVLSADAMVAAVLASDRCVYWTTKESTADRCVVETQRRGAPSPESVTWTFEDAMRARITTKEIWRSYPADMLRHRACAVLARRVYPDVVLGVYAPAELPEDDSQQTVTIIQETTRTVPEALPEPTAPQLPDPIEALRSRIADLGGEVTAEQGGALYADLELEAVPAEQRTEVKTKAWEILRKAFQGPAARLKAHALFAQLLNDCARIETRPELEALVLKPEVINTIARLPYKEPDERGQACKILGDCAYTIGWVGFDSWLQERIRQAGGKPPQPPRGGAPKPTTSNDSVEGEALPSKASLGEALAMKELRDSVAEKQADRKLTDDSKAIGIGRAYAKRLDDLGRYRAEARALVIDALLPLGSGDEVQASARLDGIVKAYQGSGRAPSMVRRAA